MNKDIIIKALEGPVKVLQTLIDERNAISAKIAERVEIKRKELLAKLEADLTAFSASVLPANDAKRLTEIDGKLSTAESKALMDTWRSITFRGRRGKGEGLAVSRPVLDEAKRDAIYTVGRDTANEKHVRIPYAMHAVNGDIVKALIAEGANDGSARSAAWNGRHALGLIK